MHNRQLYHDDPFPQQLQLEAMFAAARAYLELYDPQYVRQIDMQSVLPGYGVHAA